MLLNDETSIHHLFFANNQACLAEKPYQKTYFIIEYSQEMEQLTSDIE